jgi:repressor LexA
MTGEKKLTEKQQAILDYIKNRILDSGYPPTVREIGDNFGITVKGAYDHVKAIEKKGYIRTEQNKSRAIVVLQDELPQEEQADGITIPLVGRIAAGGPVLAAENIEDYLSFPKSAFGSGTFFALQVRGDSMEDGGIFEGDIAVIRQQPVADNGEIVAAMIGEEATLKEFRKDKDRVRLVAHNPSYSDIEEQDVTILGKLAALFRRY